jgi:N-acetylglucosaminyldiphosphoundecaprenol N-acetyl-beta-D-mannosaminyltransferase
MMSLELEAIPDTSAVSPAGTLGQTSQVWGVGFIPWTYEETVHNVDRLIKNRTALYCITANLNFMMLWRKHPDVREASRRAAFVVADGIPLVIASRWKGRKLPERVTGADLIFGLCELASRRGYRVYFFGAGPGVAEKAARRLSERYPGLTVAGVESPPFRDFTPAENEAAVARVREARPDLLFVSLGQPKGELWLMRNFEKIGVPVSIQVGAAFDFAAGTVRRAPRWVQKFGIEMLFRLMQDPVRLAPRYARNALFLARMILGDVRDIVLGRPQS